VEEHTPLIFHGGQGRRIAAGALVIVVERREFGPVGGGIRKGSICHCRGAHDHVAGHGQKAPDALAHSYARRLRSDDIGKSPDGDNPPGLFSREELPVADHVSGESVADIVRRHGELVDGHEDLAVHQFRHVEGNDPGFGKRGPTDLNLGNHAVNSDWAR